MSDDDREQRTAYLQGIWQRMLKDMAESRKTTAQQLDQLANDSIIAFADTKDYIKAKLVDGVMYPEKIKEVIRKKLGLDDDDDDINQLSLNELKQHPYMNYYQAKAIVDYRRKHGRIADLDELRLLPDFTSEAIGRLRPYITY
jgi:protease-4